MSGSQFIPYTSILNDYKRIGLAHLCSIQPFARRRFIDSSRPFKRVNHTIQGQTTDHRRRRRRPRLRGSVRYRCGLTRFLVYIISLVLSLVVR